MAAIKDGFWTLVGGAIVLLAFIGYFVNIVKIFGAMSDPLTGGFLVRCFGVLFFPLGSIAGFV